MRSFEGVEEGVDCLGVRLWGACEGLHWGLEEGGV
jgi:hypothetical protein